MPTEGNASEQPVLRLLIEVPPGGLHDLLELLLPLKHVAYRSDLWLTERGEPSSRSSDNGSSSGETESVLREPS